ncbi:MAG TPA: hypothetical protein VHT73_17710 [Thermodesulfobacteriota bacterium]|nr:hypothetical protein [Thermodesulfobacteriota bacterium]
MRVTTTAGDFEILLEDATVEGDYIVLKGKMGVWDSKTYLSAGELWLFTSLFLRPSVLLFLLKLPFRSLFGHKDKEG